MIAAEADAQVEDKQLARFKRPISRRPAPRVPTKILAEVGKRFAQRANCYGLQFGINIELVRTRPNDRPRVLVHRAVRFVRPREHPQFIRILPPPQFEHNRIDLHERHVPTKAQVGRKRLELAGHAFRLASHLRLQRGRACGALLVARCRIPFGFVANEVIGRSRRFNLPIGQHERHTTVRRNGRDRLERCANKSAGRPLNRFAPRKQHQVHAQRLDGFQQPPLPTATRFDIHRVSVHLYSSSSVVLSSPTGSNASGC
jgi:hypothetical protein